MSSSPSNSSSQSSASSLAGLTAMTTPIGTALDIADETVKIVEQTQQEENTPQVVANKLAAENAAMRAAIQAAWNSGDVQHLAGFVAQP